MYFPQALDWVGELGTVQSCDFLQLWPTLTAILQDPPSQVRQFYQQHHCGRPALIQKRLHQISTARSLTDDPAVVAWLKTLEVFDEQEQRSRELSLFPDAWLV